MRLYEETIDVKSDGEFSGGESKIKASAHAFAVLSKGLYSDPHLAIVRELSCNAWDSHIASGNTDKKFEVCLPNALAPVFKVRDYGTGLSSDAAVLKMYDYFDSTKQQSDTMTGCFGLGAKSPYAYTKKFTTINFFNGKATHFISFLNEKGIPDTLKMAENDTDQPNGLEVSFGVEPEDFYHFEHAARRALRVFTTKPIMHGVSHPDRFFEEDARIATMAGDDWKLYGVTSAHSNGCVAIMGNVAYPLGTTVRKGMSKAAQKILPFNVEIVFPLGSFEITPAREAVQWTEFSVNNINDKLEAIYDSVLKHVNEKIQGASNYWNACIEAQELQKGIFHSFITELTYGGREIHRDVPIHGEFKLVALSADTPRRDSYGHASAKNSVGRSECNGVVRPNPTPFYFADYKGATNKIENHVRHDKARGNKVYYVQHLTWIDKKNEKLGVIEKVAVPDYSKDKLQEFCDKLGIDIADVQMVSSIPDNPRAASTRRARLAGSKARAFTYNFHAYGEQHDRYWNEYDCDLAAVTEGVYVEIGLWQLRNTKFSEKPVLFQEDAKRFASMGIKFPDDRLVGVKTADMDKFKKASNWKSLDVWVVEQLQKLWADPDFQFAYHVLYSKRQRRYSRYEMEEVHERTNFFKQVAKLSRANFKSCPTWLGMVDLLKKVLAASDKVTHFNQCAPSLDATLDQEMKADCKSADALVEMTIMRYPLVTAIHDRHNYSSLRSHVQAIAHYVQLIDNEVTTCPSSSAST